MSDKDRERAENLYRKLLAIFPRYSAHRPKKNNVIRFPGQRSPDQAVNKSEVVTALHPEQSPWSEETRDRDRPRGIEGLLRQLFEEIETDD